MGREGFGAGEGGLDGWGRGGVCVLEIRAEVADEAALFLGGALVIEGDEAGEEGLFEGLGGGAAAGEDIGGRDGGGGDVCPAVGLEDGGIEVVVELLEDGDEALVVDGLVLGGEGLAGTEFLEDVVEAGEGEVGMCLLLAFAVRYLINHHFQADQLRHRAFRQTLRDAVLPVVPIFLLG